MLSKYSMVLLAMDRIIREIQYLNMQLLKPLLTIQKDIYRLEYGVCGNI